MNFYYILNNNEPIKNNVKFNILIDLPSIKHTFSLLIQHVMKNMLLSIYIDPKYRHAEAEGKTLYYETKKMISVQIKTNFAHRVSMCACVS